LKAVLRDDNLELLTFSDLQNLWSRSRLSLERSWTESGPETSLQKARIAAGNTGLRRHDVLGAK